MSTILINQLPSSQNTEAEFIPFAGGDGIAYKNEINQIQNRTKASGNTKGFFVLKSGFDLTSDLSSYANCILEIRYNFDLGGGTATMPSGVVLVFNGGKISNGLLISNQTEIKGGLTQIFDNNLTFTGSLNTEYVLPEWFGAVADGTTDSYSAFQSANLLERPIKLQKGSYVLSQTFTLGDYGAKVVGAGIDETYLIGNHTSGAVLRTQGWANELSGFTITSSDTRFNTGGLSDFGLQIEPPDTSSSAECKFGNTTLVRVTYQPGHGIVYAGGFMAASLNNFRIDKCKGHGLVLDNGTITSRTNIRRLGGISVQDGVIQDCVGHSVKCGGENETDNRPYRIKIENVDMFRCAVTAGVRLENTCAWIFASNSIIERCAFNGYDYATGSFPDGFGQGASVISGLTLTGRSVHVLNNRFIDCSTYAVRVIELAELTVREIKILGFRVAGTNLSNAVFNEAGKLDVEVYTQNYFFIDDLMTNDELVLADDSAGALRFSAITRGTLMISANASSGGAALVHFRCGDGSAFCTIVSSSGATYSGSVGSLNGTTGTDGQFNIGVDNSSNIIYFENRLGVGLNYTVKVLNSNATIQEDLYNI